MRLKQLLVYTLFLCPLSAFATTAVTGHITRLDTTTPGVTAYVRFWLRGTRGNQPRITGAGAIAPQFSGSTFYVDLPADASGNISGTIYSTRDSGGTGAGDIEAGGSYTAVYYGMQIVNGGIPGPEIPVHARSGGTLDIANVSAVSTLPVVTAPTGDTTYARLDGGNTPFSGPVSFGSTMNATHGGSLGGTFTGNTSLSGNITENAGQNILSAYSLNNIVYIDGIKYACSGAGIASAIASLSSGGVVDAKGCIGSFTGGALTTTVPITLLLGPSSWAMGSSTITLANGSKLIGLGHQSTTLTWTGDVDGIATPTGTTGGNVTVQGLSLVSGGLSSASHAVVHLIDCPYCHVDDVFVSFDSSAASAGIRVEAVTANSGYGTWSGTISRSTVQRTSANQGTRATSGQIDIDFKGNSGVTNGNISRWMLWGNHLEGGTINFQIFCGSANKFIGGDMFSGAPSVNITGNGSCNSNDNISDTELNGVGIAGSKAFAIDAFSNFNTIAGDISQNLVAPTDAGSDNLKWYSTNVLGAGVYSLGSKTFALATASGTATVDLASVASGACTADSSDVTLTGAAVGDPVRVTAATALPAGVWLIGRVTATNTGRFQLCNLSGGAVDRASDTYTISVVK